MNKIKIVIITGSELRHDFFRKYIALEKGIIVLKTYCELGTLKELVLKDDINENTLRKLHLEARERIEKDFFEQFIDSVEDKSNSIKINNGEINNSKIVSEIINLNPDLIISYGCSIIKSILIEKFTNKFINIHLGLSPYYRGSGTNFWPFVNGELQFIGATFMHIDKGVDTGQIIHQIRPEIVLGDSVHQIGNRLIVDMTKCLIKIIFNLNNLVKMEPIRFDRTKEKYYKNKDFTEKSVLQVYNNLQSGIIMNYIQNKKTFIENAPIIQNSLIN